MAGSFQEFRISLEDAVRDGVDEGIHIYRELVSWHVRFLSSSRVSGSGIRNEARMSRPAAGLEGCRRASGSMYPNAGFPEDLAHLGKQGRPY